MIDRIRSVEIKLRGGITECNRKANVREQLPEGGCSFCDYNEGHLAVMMEQGWKQHNRFHPFLGFQPDFRSFCSCLIGFGTVGLFISFFGWGISFGLFIVFP